MPGEESDLFGWMLFRGLGVLAGLILAFLLFVFLTGPERRKIRRVLLFLALHVVLMALRLPFPRHSPTRNALRLSAIFLLVSSIGLSIFLLVTSSRLSAAFIRPLPKIFLDILHGVVFFVALLITLAAAGVEPMELLTGSALLTAVIGLSLRDTLGNLFAGLAIQAQRPFEVGDWIQFNQDRTQIGQVVEINWRATTVLTRDRVEVIVPNGLLAQAPIVNYSRPTAVTRRAVLVQAPLEVPPLRVKAIILAAIADSPGVLADPGPSATTSNFTERGVEYTVRFFIDDFGRRGKIESVVRDRIWYALARNNIDLPVPPRSIRVQKAGKRAATRREEGRIARCERALGCVDFFDRLPPEARHQLAGLAEPRLYADQEVIIRQGEGGDELFILESGEVVVTAEEPGKEPVEVARLGAGTFFGEMAALTGEPRRATVRAARECEVLVVGKAALAQVFESSPELAEHISQTIARRQANLSTQLAEHAAPPPQAVAEHSHRLLQRIKEFFSM